MTTKSQSYPETVPAAYAKHSDTERAYRMGWNHGHGIACHNVPTLGEKVFSESLGRVTVDAENIREVHESACFEAESNSRQFSPFEFIASEFNERDKEPETLNAVFNRFEIELPYECAVDCSHQGDCEADVRAWLTRIPDILADIDPEDIRAELKEYGAWNDEELTDDEANRRRLLWTAACNANEEFKALPDCESLWEAFDAGIADAIRADLATYEDSDYGIESEDAGNICEDEDTSTDPFPHTSERETQE